ncbi:O-antigen ligase family protein [Dyadobacter tibetensis]|uniref:O-antigen ligase family protein n=1 Tax=Dyadobacter tibetensis TaxID=1211851 RepID=UPI0004708BFB|nr:O-antigen ligase family protein [Dyadobacter tibetensis]
MKSREGNRSYNPFRGYTDWLYDYRTLATLSVVAVCLGVLTVKGGLSTGVLVLVGLAALPTVYAMMMFPFFGILCLIILAYFLFFIFRMGVNFPLGTVLDGMQAFLLLSLIISHKKRPDWSIFRGPVSVMILVWVGYNLLQVINPAAESRLAWVYTVRTVAVITLMYYVFVYYIRTLEQVRILLVLWLTLSLVAALYAYRQEYLGFPDSEMATLESDPLNVSLLFIDGHWRKYSIFSDPVEFSYNMVLGCLLCIVLLLGPIPKWMKVLLVPVLVFMGHSMLFSGTRGAYVLVPAALVMLAILKFSKQIMIGAILATFFFVALIFIPTSNPSIARFQTAFRPGDDASYNVRKMNQARIKPYILSHPMGGGLGATGMWGVRFAPYSYLANFPPDSGYVRVAVELGWIGLFLFCILMYIFLSTGIDQYYRIRNPELKMYCLAMILVLFALNIGNFPQEALVQYPNNILFYLAIALIQVCYRLDKSDLCYDR